jgi:hypothetical protein
MNVFGYEVAGIISSVRSASKIKLKMIIIELAVTEIKITQQHIHVKQSDIH